MRAKVRYPSLLEYAQTYHAAFRELVKKFSEDYSFNTAKRKPGKCYGNQEGIQFCLETIEVKDQNEKKKTYQVLKRDNQGTPAQRETSKKLAEQFRCFRKKLLIRETTCRMELLAKKSK